MSLLSSGCHAITAHENFNMILGQSVGKSIDAPPTLTNAYSRRLLRSDILENGNVENEYRYRGSCRYFYEIDPKTRLIVGFRFVGSEADCAIEP